MSKSLPKLYVKTGCPWCEEAIDFLDQKKIAYEKIVVSNNPKLMQEMVDLSGQSKAPTLDWDGEILADFGVDELLPFLKKHHSL
jgi:glutaredoxin 3